MFEKNLQDLVKGIRSAKGDVSVYISQCMQEIKTELKSTDPFVKAQAIRKLTYLHMLGFDMCWAAFHVVEVMSYERFAHKRIGYTAASQSFTQSTDVVLLCTNLLKKEFGAHATSNTSAYDVGLAINVLANIVTTDLARDLLGDVVAMMQSHHPYIRKKATLVLYKMYLRYPQALRLTFDKLQARMADEPDVAVVSCAVNVICELANKKPKNYVGLAPQFFRLLTTSSNNWMLIKVVKLLASLVPEEPRLARKLLDPLATVIQNTPAKSLLYECISTVTTALLYTQKSDGTQPRNVAAIVRLCNDHLRRYIEDADQNLRYLGLVGLSNLMQSHPFVIAEHEALIVACLAVDDMTIRMRALELLSGMVHADNAAQIIQELMRQTLSADGAYRHELIARILHVCSVNKYANIHDFDWYIHVLVQLARVPSLSAGAVSAHAAATAGSNKNDSTTKDTAALAVGSYERTRLQSHGIEVARQLLDIAMRVKSVRSVLVDNMVALLLEPDALSSAGAATLSEVFYAAAWIAGEYVTEYLDDVRDEERDDDDDDDDASDDRETEDEKLARIEDLVDEMLQPRTTSLPAHVQTVYIQALLKLLTATAERADDDAVDRVSELLIERLPAFVQSEHIEVQERAVSLQQILLALGMGTGALSAHERTARAFDRVAASLTPDARLDVLNAYFSERLAPVGVKAQRKVPLPAGLDLDAPFSATEASFLESGGDVSMFANEDDLDVSFVRQDSSNSNNGDGYMGLDDSHSSGRKPTSSRRRHGGRKSSYDRPGSADDGGSSSSDAQSSSTERQQRDRDHDRAQLDAREKERLRKDPFYLSGSGAQSGLGGSSNDNSGFAGIMDALDAAKRSGKKSRKSDKKSTKSRAVLVEDELMPDGARSSDDDHARRRSSKKKHPHANLLHDDDDLSAIDLSVPLGANEKIPDEHLYHRQTAAPREATGRSDKKKASKTKPKASSSSKSKSSKRDDDRKASKASSSKSHRRHHDKGKDATANSDDDEQAHRRTTSRRSAKTSSSSSHRHESKENVVGGNASASSGDDDDNDNDRRQHVSKTKSKSKSSKARSERDGSAAASATTSKKSDKKSDKRSKKRTSDKSHEQQQQDDLLLLF